MAIRDGATFFMVFEGTARPIPEKLPLWVWIAVFIPITSPLVFSSGPPEFPGFIAASICMTPGMEYLPTVWNVLPSWLTTPVVSEPPSPNGLPIATTGSPTDRLDESPKATGLSVTLGLSILITAMSVKGSVATRRALLAAPLRNLTSMLFVP